MTSSKSHNKIHLGYKRRVHKFLKNDLWNIRNPCFGDGKVQNIDTHMFQRIKMVVAYA